MKRDNLPWRALTPAALAWSADGEPVSTTYNDVYFSRDDGPAESTHVFLAGNRLPQRFSTHPHPVFCVGETGFGTGLNFLLTWQAWRDTPGTRPDLHFLSIDKHPLSRADLARALSLWPQFEPLVQPLLAAYPDPVPGQHRLVLDGGRVRLDLWWEDAADTLADLAAREDRLVDAWYLDGFAPDRNGDMWNAQILSWAALLSREGATFATFTAAGHVRRKLQDAGFVVEKTPGYGRKRECLRGVFDDPDCSPPSSSPGQQWDLLSQSVGVPASALVLGGGLAGCTTAAALAGRGIEVTLLERGELAGAGSSMDQGIIYNRLSRQHAALADFALQSFLFATNFYRDLFASGQLIEGSDGALCGNFQQSNNLSDMAFLQEALAGLDNVAQVCNAEQASALLGINQPHGGFWYPRSGWLHPAAVCRTLLAHPRIQLLEHCGDVSLVPAGHRWQARQADSVLAEADCAVAATGPGITLLTPFEWLPVQTIRGQVTHLRTTDSLSVLQAALCHEGYIAPARNGVHTIGATFDIGNDNPALLANDHRHNLDRLGAAVPACQPELAALDPDTLGGAVGFRCASPDYLPLVGPAPDLPAFLATFGALRKNARENIHSRGSHHPGLYLNTGHGSRGLTYTPLAAELLASLICGEPPPLDRHLCRALSPARFIIRDLIRNRI